METCIPKVVGPYKVCTPIGYGSFSICYQAIHSRTKEIVALKFVKRQLLKNEKVLSNFEREIRIAERISHKNIVSFYNIFYLDDFIVIAMECLGNGTMDSFINSTVFQIDHQHYVKWAKDVLEGLYYLHQKKIAHHDIKPDNIGFDDMMNAKILDIGLCEEYDDFCYEKVGTFLFLAPEKCFKNRYDGEKADIWSFGVTFHYLVTGKFPFINIDNINKMKSIKDVKANVVNRSSGPLKEILDLALKADPKERPTTKDLLSFEIFKTVHDNSENDFRKKFYKGIQPKRKSCRHLIIVPVLETKRQLIKGKSQISCH